jgi:hypothetical protein
MSEGGTPFQPGADEVTVPFRGRDTYAGYRAFGSGDGAVLVKPEVARDLRRGAEFATQEGRITGGLLYGRGWADDQGAYLVVNGYVEAGPGENRHDRFSRSGADDFTLSEADLRLLREDASRMYTAELEVGWWRTLPALGEFGPQDFETQAELVGPDGVGLLVYGSGPHWGTAYLGPIGLAPDSAGTLVAVADPEPQSPADAGPQPEFADVAPGAGPVQEPPPPAGTVPPAGGTGIPGSWRTRPRVTSRVRVPPRIRLPVRGRAPRQADPVYTAGPETPPDVQLVVIALAVVVIAAAIIIGVLVSSAIVGVIIAVVGLLAIFGSVWMSHR